MAQNEDPLETGTEQELDRMSLISPNTNKINRTKCILANFFWDAAMKINRGQQQGNYISK